MGKGQEAATRTPALVWWVFSQDGRRVATIAFAEDAAAFVALLGAGAFVRTYGGVLVWNEGSEIVSAGESYDAAAETMRERAGWS